MWPHSKCVSRIFLFLAYWAVGKGGYFKLEMLSDSTTSADGLSEGTTPRIYIRKTVGHSFMYSSYNDLLRLLPYFHLSILNLSNNNIMLQTYYCRIYSYVEDILKTYIWNMYEILIVSVSLKKNKTKCCLMSVAYSKKKHF